MKIGKKNEALNFLIIKVKVRIVFSHHQKVIVSPVFKIATFSFSSPFSAAFILLFPLEYPS